MTSTLPNFVTALGSKMTSFKKISALLVLLLISSLSFGQNAIVGTGFSTGWGGGSCPTGNSNFKYLSLITGANGTGTYGVTTAANGTGNQYMRFGIDWSTTNGQYAINPGTDTAILPNTSYNLNIGCTVSGSQFINVGSTSYNYVFKTFNAGTNPTGTFAFFEVQGAVQSVSSVTQSPVAASVVPSSNVTVTANLSGSLSTGQAVYLRYTNNAFANSTVVQMTGSGSTYTAQIPSSMNGQNKTVAYYVFTSGNSLNSANSGATGVYANGNNADLFTINLNNNGGSNYSYTVANSPVIVNATTGTVGPTGYATFAAAVTAINAGTHTGVVTVSIVGATTEGTANIPINASGSGSASYTSITVKPAGGAQTLTAATVAGAAFITLNGADNVTFDGLNTNGNSLTISNTTVSATSGSCTLSFIGDATSNTVTNCTILGSTSMAADTNGGNIFFGAGAVSVGNDNNTISNCNIGPAGANLPTKAIHFGGTSNALNNSGIVINNNNIYDYFGAAVESAGIYITTGTQDASITNNRFYQTASRTQTTASLHSGIKILNLTSAGLYTISGNTIGYASSTGTGSYTLVGIAGTLFNPINLTVGTTTATSIQGNTIKAIAMSGAASGTSTSSPFIGIYVASGLSTIGDVTANTIGDMSATGSITYTSSSTSTSEIYGMYNFGSSNWTTNNNNIGGITVANSSTGATNFYGLRCNTGSGVTWTCTNNTIGGTVSNSISSTSTATGTIVNGILSTLSIGTFTGNIIRNLTVAGGTGTGTSSSLIGIRIDATSAQTVSQNQIYNLTNSNTGAIAVTVTGIRNASTATNTFARNILYNYSVATSIGSNINGIAMAATTGTNTVQNNMVRLGYDSTGASITGGHIFSGINSVGGTNNYYFNSVYIGGTGVTGTNNTGCFNSTGSTTHVINLRNNIFSNARSNGTGTGKHYAIYYSTTPTTNTSNYNDYFTSGTGGVLGFLTSDRTTLATWQTATAQDVNSVNANPQFIAPTSATPDLHINASVATVIEGSGVNISGITDDYDGQTRSGLTPTDIGADAGNFVSSIVACATPTAQPTALTFSNVTTTTLSGSFTAASPVPTGYVVIRSTSSTLSGNPVDGTSYTAGNSLGGGTVIVPTGTTFTDSALTAGTMYYYFVLSYNSGSCSGGPKYLTTTPLTNNQVTVCATATALAAGTVTATSATLNWTGAGNYIVEYGAAGFTPGTGATTGVGGTIATSAGTNPYTLSGLTANTTYDVYVRQVCAAGGFYSANATKVTFTTACAAITSFPSVEPFTAYLPSVCWREGDLGDLTAGPTTFGTSVSDWGVDGFLNSGTTGAAKMNIDAATGSEWIISPYYTIPATGYRVKYSVGATQWNAATALTTAWEADDFVQLLVSTSNTNWTVLKTYNSANVPSYLGQTDDVDLTAYNGQTVQFAFRAFEGATNGSADIDFFIDNFTVEISPSCLPATINTTTSITSTTATINWAASASAPSNGYNYEIRTSGAAGSGATGLTASGSVAAGVLTANVTGLTAATSYSVYVQSDCGGSGTSTWSTAGAFTTACDVPNNSGAISMTSPLATGFTLNYSAASPAPTNYILFASTGTVATAIPTLVTGTTYNNATVYPFGGNNYTCVTNTSASPQVVTGGVSNTQYNYFLYSKSTTNSCFGNPYYSTGVTFSAITCPAAPTAFVNSAISTSGATVSWTASAVGGAAGAISYTLEVYSDSGYTTPISGSPFSVGTPVTYNLTGLTSATTYYYKVKANNGSCDSVYLSGGTVTTLCNVVTSFPYTMAFDGSAACWTTSTGTAPWALGSSSTDITAPQSGSGFIYKPFTTSTQYLYSAPMDLSSFGSNQARLNFWIYRHSATVVADQISFKINTTNSNTGATNLQTYSILSTQTPAEAASGWYNYKVDIPTSWNSAGTVYVVIEGVTTAGISSYDIGLDNFVVEAKPLPITITPSASTTICSGDSVGLTATSGAAYTYTWSPATGLSATTGATVSANPTATTIYTVTGVAGAMTTTQTITVTVNPTPAAVTITPSTTTCPNVITTLTASSASIGTYTVGTSSGSSAAANTPYRQSVSTQARMQYLITKAEMNASGINGSANITSIAFNVTSVGGGTIPTYTISMGNSNATVMTTTFQTPTLTTVYTGTNYVVSSGVNTHAFTTPFAWDGTSNVIVNICMAGVTVGTTSTVSISTPAVVSTTSLNVANACSTATGNNTSANRPVMTFGVAGQITWTPTTDLYTDSGATTSYSGGAASTVYSKPTATITYTATASLGSCTKTNTTTITTKIPVGITSVTAGASPICSTATTSLTANGVVGTNAVVTWYTGAGGTGTNLGTGTTLTAGPGTYYARVTGDCGSPVEASVTVGSKVNVGITGISVSVNPICSSTTATLTANGVVGTNAVVTWYTGAGGTGTNLGTGVTTTKGPGTYYARVTGDCGTAEANFTINAIAEPTWANLQWPPTGAICQTGSYTAYGQVYQSGVTDSAGQGSGITVQFGYNGTDTDPSTWTSWSAASYNVDYGNNDEYLYTFTPPSSGTFYYTFRYRQGSCNWIYGGYSAGGGGAWSGSNVSGILTVTASPSAGTLGGSQAVCISDSTTFTSTSSDGSWSSSDTGVASINATTGVVTPVAAGTATMTYTVTGTGGCSNATNTRTVTVNQVTNGGTASSNQIICSGETPSAITLASSVGSVVKWQSSSDAAFTSPTDITNTSTTLTLGSLSATTYYRAVVQSGACSSANSNVVTITVNSLPTVSIASNNSPVCSGAASFSLTGTTDAVVTYNINGGTNATTTLTGGAATISVPNPFASQVLTLVSVANNGCTSSLSDTSTVSVFATTYNGTSWSNGDPDSSKLAIFTGNYTIAADLTACSLRVTNNAVVTVNSNYNVYLNGAITVDSGSSFTMNNNSNLFQADASAVNTGNIVVKRNTSTIVRLDHTLWSSPVTGQNLFSFSPNTLVNRFYVYNTATNSYVTTGLSNTSLFTPAKGFAVRAPNNQSATTPAVWTGTFTGVPNNGTKTFTLATNAANGYNYNLVGNPYPSAISASNFYAANASKIGGTLYFYAHTLTMNASGIFPTGTNYATWTGLGGAAATAGDGHTPAVAPNGIIQVGQGFIVRATASGDVTFTNSMRVANQQNQFMKAATASAETHRMWLNLKTDTGVDVNQILVGYMDGATQGVDAGLDGLSFGNTGSYLYSKIENDNFVIQARSLPFDVTDEVPLGFNCATAGSYSISLTNTDGLFAADQDILVRDNLTGTDTSIKTVPYTFNSETGVFDTRFRLVYTQALGVPSTNFTENSVIVYKNTDWFHVNTKGIEMKDIMVYDISGRLIYSKKDINATTAVLNGLTTTNQVLILKINSIEDKTVTIKVIN